MSPESAAVQPEAPSLVVERVRSAPKRAKKRDDFQAAPIDVPPKPGAALIWGLSLVLAVIGLGFTGWELSRTTPAAMFEAASTDAQQAALGGPFLADTSADYYDARMRAGLRIAPNDLGRAAQNARKAIERDPRNGFAYAVLAMAEAKSAGGLTAQAEKDLRMSVKLCPMCDQNLTRMRFRFVLENWTLAPEDLRRAVFTEAETLRWTGRDAEYLAEMKLLARNRGVPFDRYDAQVVSPVPSMSRPKPAR